MSTPDSLGQHRGVDNHAFHLGQTHKLDVGSALYGGFQQLLDAALTQQAPKAVDLAGVAQQAPLAFVRGASAPPLHDLGPALHGFLVARVDAVFEVRQTGRHAND